MAKFVPTLPNWITLGRIALIPIFVILMIEPSRSMVWAATVVFVLAALTDYLDGFLARRWNQISDFGKLADPVADKILVMAALVMLVAQRSDIYGEPWVPGWMVVLILSREIWVTGVRAVVATRGLILPAGNAGKLKSGLQMVAIVLLLLHDYPMTIMGYKITAQLVGVNLLLISIFFSYLSLVEYTREVITESAPLTAVKSDPASRTQDTVE